MQAPKGGSEEKAGSGSAARPGDVSDAPLWKKWAWFVGLWAGGVLVVGQPRLSAPLVAASLRPGFGPQPLPNSIHTGKTRYRGHLAANPVPLWEVFQPLAVIDLSTGLC